MAESRLEALIIRLEKVADRLEGGNKPQSHPQAKPIHDSFDFSKIHSSYVAFLEAAKATGLEDINKMSQIIIDLFKFHEKIVQASVSFKKPTEAVYQKIQAHIKDSLAVLNKNYIYPRVLEFQGKTILEGASAIFWIFSEMPVPAIKGVIESTEYSVLKVKSQQKEGQNKWVDTYITILKELLNFVTATFSTGLTWTGKEESDFDCLFSDADVASSTPSTCSKAEPKKEDPKKAEPKKEEAKHADIPTKPAGGGMGALFAQLNKGEAITKELKHVDKKKLPIPENVPKPVVHATTKSAKIDDSLPTEAAKKTKGYNNWLVKNFVNEQIELGGDDVTLKDMIIFENCYGCTIRITSKVKCISINNCKKLLVAFTSVLSNVEVLHSKSVEVFCQESCPSMSVDASESIKVTLSKDLNTEIISSKVSELNVTRLNDAGEYEKDFPVTEQFSTKWDAEKGTFVTTPMNLFL